MKHLLKIFGVVSFIIIFFSSVYISCDNPTIYILPEPVYYTVTFDSNGGSQVASQKIENGKTAIKPDAPKRNNYIFSDWYNGDSVFDFSTPITHDIKLTAHWTKNTSEDDKKPYIVKHYQEKLDDSGYELVETDIQILMGKIGDKTKAVAKDYEGFTAQNFTQTVISAEENIVVNIYYKRNIITLTFDIADASWENGDTEKIKTLTGKYGAEVIYTFGLPYKPNCISRGWDKTIQKIFTIDETYTAVCVQSDQAHYKVKHYQQAINDDSYIEIVKDQQNLVGDVGAMTTAIAKSYAGFTVKAFTQKTITVDESTIVEIYYDRIEVTLTFLPNGGIWSDGTAGVKLLKGRYGSSFNIELPVKTGYEAAWDEDLQDKFTANKTYSVVWTPISVNYTVEHYQENAGDDNYSLYQTETLNGLYDSLTGAKAKQYEGFTAQGFSQTVISAEENTVVRIYYKRNIITLTFDIADASWENGDTEKIKTLTGKYGAEVIYTFGLPYKPNCTIRKWDKPLPRIFITDTTYTAVCVQSDQAHYKVKHYQQSIDDDSYIEIVKDQQNLVGDIDSTTTAIANHYEGFTAKTFTQKTIKVDESTVVEIYYDRIEVTLTFLSNGGTWSDGTAGVKLLKGRYGSSFNIELPVKTGYKAAWDEEVYNTFTANKTYSVVWTPILVNYSVEHYKENTDNDNYSLYKTETLSGLYNSLTAAKVKDYEGFTAESFTQTVISAEEDTVVKIYYKRNIITLTFDIADASWENGDTEKIKTLTGKYGAEVIYTFGLPYKPNCISRGWDKTIQKIFTTDETYTAVCVQSEQAHYKVKHYQQAIDDDSYIEIVKDQQNLVGDVGAMTTAVAKSYAGFTVKAFTQKTITVDESTVVEIYYDRIEVTLTFLSNGGIWSDGTAGVKLLKGRYGSSFNIELPVKTGYEAAWDEEVYNKFTANKTYSVVWTPISVNYTVEHYQENADDDNYSLYQTETLSGLYDSMTVAEANEYDGFVTKSFEQKSITNNTIIKIYYERKRYSLTFEKNDDSSESVIVSAKQGAKVITYAPQFTRQYYKLSWEFDSSKQVTKNEVFVAQWTGQEVRLDFFANYGSDPTAWYNNKSQIFRHGEPKTIPKDLCVHPDGYILAGWATSKNSTEIIYENGATITFHIGCGEPDQFYAVWQKPITVVATKAANTITKITDTDFYLIKITGTLTSSIREEINTAIESCQAKIQLDLSECQIVEWQSGEPIDAVYAASVIGTFDDTSTHSLKITGTLYTSLLKEITSVIKTRNGLIELDISETTGLQTLPDDCFKDCKNLKTVILPNEITTLGSSCFQNCTSLSTVTLPTSITKIEGNAFYNCSSITDIAIPANVTEIGGYAFAGTGITSIVIPSGVKNLSYTFKDCINLSEVTLPNTIESLYRTFQNCTSLQYLTIPNSIETLNGTFIGCTSLTNIDIPSSIKNIGDYTFDNCGLLEISIPSTVTSIGKNAFSNCRKLQSIVIPNSITEISDESFWGCEELSSVTIPNSVTKIGNEVFGFCVSITSITIPNSVTSIGYGAFMETSLASIVIPNLVTSIESNVFYKCSFLKSITIPDSVTSIGASAFEKCTSLSSIKIPNSVTTIGRYAFSETAIMTITLPSGITALYEGTFYGCKSLQGLIIPAAVESIAPRVFFDTFVRFISFENQMNWVYENESGNIKDINVSNSGMNAGNLCSNGWAMNGIRIKKQ